MRKDIFRETALERLSSPEQLDQLMQVTTPRGWVALAGLGTVIAAALAWGIFGSVTERVHGQGILVRGGGVYQVVSESDGRVAELRVRPGEVIREGQVVARLAQPELDEQVHQAGARVAELEARYAQVAESGGRDVALQSAYLGEARSSLEQSVAAGEHALGGVARKMADEEQLVAQGLITRQTLLATVQEHDRLREEVRADRAELAQLQVRALQSRTSNETTREETRFKLLEARRELARLEGERRLRSELTSPYTGRVLELLAERGSWAAPGQPLLTVDVGGRAGTLEAVVYVPSAQGKKIAPGMLIQLVPSTVRREEHGALVGRVTSVSDFPSTARGMQRVLKNEQLAAALSGRDAPYEVRAELVPDARTESGYRWTSAAGPALRIQGGTLADAAIVVQRRRPVSLAIPQLRKQVAAAPRAGLAGDGAQ